MVRQGTMLRDDARTRERRATEMVEARYASLIANASDVILIVEEDGAVRFASPAFERTFGLDAGLRVGAEPPRTCGAAMTPVCCAASSPTGGRRLSGAVGPIELRLERDGRRYTLEAVGSNLTDDPAVNGLALNLRDISERKALEQRLREQAFRDPLTRAGESQPVSRSGRTRNRRSPDASGAASR